MGGRRWGSHGAKTESGKAKNHFRKLRCWSGCRAWRRNKAMKVKAARPGKSKNSCAGGRDAVTLMVRVAD